MKNSKKLIPQLNEKYIIINKLEQLDTSRDEEYNVDH